MFLNEASAARTKVSVGQQLEVVIANYDFTEVSAPEAMVVVGVGLFPDEVYEDETGAKPALMFAKDFVDGHRDLIVWGAVYVELARDADRADAIAEMLDGGLTIDNDRRTDRDQARAAIRPLAVTLAALALLAGLATIVVIGQGLRRLVQRSPAEAISLAAAGCTRAMLVIADVAVALTVGVAGALGAIALAVLVSPLFPQGRARRISDLRGFDVDLATLGLGAAGLLVTLTVLVAVTPLRRRRRRELRPGSAPGMLGASPAIGTGVRLATSQRGVLGAVIGAAVGLTAIVAAVTFTGSMENLVSRPELAGFNWDLVGRDAYAVIDSGAVADRVGDDPDVERITGLTYADVEVDGKPLSASVWAAIKGSPWPSLTKGRVRQARTRSSSARRRCRISATRSATPCTVRFPGVANDTSAAVEFEMTVVGTAVSPSIGLAGTDTPRLDEGLLLRQEDIAGHRTRVWERNAVRRCRRRRPGCGQGAVPGRTAGRHRYEHGVVHDRAPG